MADTPPSTILMPLDNDDSDDDEEQEYAVVQCAFPLDLTPAQATEAIVAATAIVGPDGWETTLHIEFSKRHQATSHKQKREGLLCQRLRHR
jgi:hypothetical protein